MKKIFIASLAAVVLASTLTSCDPADHNMPDINEETNTESTVEAANEDAYNRALSLLEAGDVYGAYDVFLTISDFKDVSDYLSRFVFHLEKTVVDSYGDYTVFYTYDDYGRRISRETVYTGQTNSHRTRYLYDENGFLIQVERDSGILAGITQYEYDDKGHPIRQVEPNGFTTVLEYDSRGNIVRVVDEEYIRERVYDASGTLTEETLKTVQNFLLQTTVYEYNEQGDLIKRTVHENGGSVITYIDRQFEYDEQGNKVQCIYNQPSGMNSIGEAWEYDARGNLIKNTIYYANGEFITFHFNFDESGNKIEQYREDETGITNRTYFEYDVYGNLLKYIDVDQDPAVENSIHSYTYRLYYKPNIISFGEDPCQNMPVEMVGKG